MTMTKNLLVVVVALALCAYCAQEAHAFVVPHYYSSLVSPYLQSRRPSKPALLSSTTTTLVDEMTTQQVDEDKDLLNQPGFLTEMDSSLEGLEMHQDDEQVEADSVLPTVAMMTKQEQMDEQYERHFAKLARRATQLKAKYEQEIADIRSAPTKPPVTQGLTGPTQALAWLGAAAAVVLVGGVIGTTNTADVTWEMPNGTGEMVRGMMTNLADKVQDVVVSTTSSAAVTTMGDQAPSAAVVTPVVTTPAETVSSSSAYAFKDFAQLDFYGSSTAVEGWFSSN